MTDLPELAVLLPLCAAALAAGFVDSVSGGGGLIQVPALLTFAPGLSIASVLGTNKLSSCFGTLAALWRYRSLQLVRIRDWKYAIAAAALGGAVGALLATALNPTVLRPVVFGLTVLVLIYVVLNSAATGSMAQRPGKNESPVSPIAQSVLGGSVGSYDGFYGPGAGSFLIAALVKLLRVDALTASANAKTMNLASNAGALACFLAAGQVSFALGLTMAGFNLLGGFLGSSVAGRVGAPFVRGLLILSVSALLVKLGVEML